MGTGSGGGRVDIGKKASEWFKRTSATGTKVKTKSSRKRAKK